MESGMIGSPMYACYSYVTKSGTTRVHYFLNGRRKCECGARDLKR